MFLKHRNRPDFALLLGQLKYGIECTEAIPKQMAWAMALWEKYFSGGYFESEFFRWGSPVRTKQEIMEILTRSQSELHGGAWFGKSVEKEWATWIFDCINGKLDKLNNQTFKKYNNNYLLIYDNLPQAVNNVSLAAKLLEELLKEYWKKENIIIFNKIYVESKDFMVEFSENEHKEYSIPNLQKNA